MQHESKIVKSLMFASWSTIATSTNKIIDIESTKNTPSSPREWLEGEIRTRTCTDGAYTVVRGETVTTNGKINSIQLLGQNYHLTRLQDSYRILFEVNETDDSLVYSEAIETSKKIIGKLAQIVAESSKTEKNVITMLTLLWTPSHSNSTILVNGHIALVPMKDKFHPETACVALSPTDYHKKIEWPNRFSFHPTAKYVSWCFDRKPLEQILSPHKIIFLIDEDENSILEATTSNFFTLYDDGIWRTNMDLALHGYAQDIIYKTIDKHTTAQIKSSRVLLQESHRWKSVFVTSSVSMIQPVGKILIPVFNEGGDTDDSNQISHYDTLWEAHDDSSITQQFYRHIFSKIIDIDNPDVEKTQVYQSMN